MSNLAPVYTNLAVCAAWLVAMVIYGTWSYRRLWADPHGHLATLTEEQARADLVRVEQAKLGLSFAGKTGFISLIAIGAMLVVILNRG